MGCPATPACSTTMSHFRHSPAHSPTSTGSKTHTAVRQLCMRARLRLACRGGDWGHPLGPALCSSSLGEDGCSCEASASLQQLQGSCYLSLFQRFDLHVPVPPASCGCIRAPGPCSTGGGWALILEGLGGGERRMGEWWQGRVSTAPAPLAADRQCRMNPGCSMLVMQRSRSRAWGPPQPSVVGQAPPTSMCGSASSAGLSGGLGRSSVSSGTSEIKREEKEDEENTSVADNSEEEKKELKPSRNRTRCSLNRSLPSLTL